ncbi:unnamed protein product, partial [Durusdinium trenchii]
MKGRDMAGKLLKKKSNSGNLALQLYLKVHALVTAQKNEEEDYLPYVREMIALSKSYEKPSNAAVAISKQLNKPAAKPKAKAKAKDCRGHRQRWSSQCGGKDWIWEAFRQDSGFLRSGLRAGWVPQGASRNHDLSLEVMALVLVMVCSCVNESMSGRTVPCTGNVTALQLATSRERDLFRWLKLPLTIYNTELPLLQDAAKSSIEKHVALQPVAIVLPSDMLRALQEAGPEALRSTRGTKHVMEECLGSQHDFKALWRASGCEDMALSDFIPVIIHEVTDETREATCQILAWDFKQMEAGKFDLLNHLGNFHSLGSAREGLGGSDIPARGAFMYWKGDMEAHAYSHYLTKTRRYFKCLQCCDFCLGTSDRRCPELSWADVTLRALWRSTLTLTDDSDPSPWVRVPRFQKDRRLLDLLHLVHLGTMRDVIASSI